MKKQILLFVILNLIFIGYISAETVYINEKTVNIRTGPGTDFDVKKIVKYGYKITVSDEKDNWYKVRLKGGEEGWVSKKTITKETPVHIVIEDLQTKIASQGKENEELKEENEELKGLKASLSSMIEDLENKTRLLKEENNRLKRHSDIIWTIIGITILLTGWVMGFLFGYFRREAKKVTLRDRQKDIDREIQNLLKEKSAKEMEGTFSDRQLKDKEEILKSYDEKIKVLRAERIQS